eukprot:3088902-Ditylum_brightwellii.AAC.1
MKEIPKLPTIQYNNIFTLSRDNFDRHFYVTYDTTPAIVRGLKGNRFRDKDDSWEFKRLISCVTGQREERICFDCTARVERSLRANSKSKAGSAQLFAASGVVGA